MMKAIRKLTAFLLAAIMTMGLATTVFAAKQTESGGDGPAKITINNPAKGETYNVHKLFDAVVSSDGSKIAYQCVGDIPTALTAFFSKDSANNVIPAASILEYDNSVNPPKATGTKMTDELKAALETWAASVAVTATAESDGSDILEFTGLPYGYYVMTTTHKDDTAAKALITVTSTMPNATIYDKNATEVTVKQQKTVYNAAGEPIDSASIGDTVTYVTKFGTTNYVANGTGTDGNGAKQVVKYEISDTLPEFMSDVTVVWVKVDGTALTPAPSFGDTKSFTIDWVNENGDSLYAQGAEIEVKYTAKITSTININANNKNKISIQPYVKPDNPGDDPKPYDKPVVSEETIKTYGAAINKVDENDAPLAGAEFTIKGLTVEKVSDGVYTVVSYNPSSTTQSAVLKTDDEGKLYIVGLGEDVELTVTEVKAPAGYNMLTEPKTLTPQVLTETIYKETTTYYYDADGNLMSSETGSEVTKAVTKNLDELDAEALEIENQKGLELPTTGGIGTTIFYILGAALLAFAGVFLFVRKRVGAEK